MRVLLVFTAIVSLHGGSSYAQGALDWADPCVEQGNTFESSAAAARARADEAIQAFDAQVEPPSALRSHYVEAIREGYFKIWREDPNVVALIEQAKKEGPFDEKQFFVEKVYPLAMTPEKEADLIRQIYKRDYNEKIRPKLITDRQNMETTLTQQKDKLDSACSPDVVSQVLRATVGNLIGIVDANFKAAANEDGEIAKYIRATSGVSITDIQKYGLQGGPNSFVNEVLGGERSVARDALRILDFPKWQVEVPNLPTIEIPNIPLPELPPLPDICIPWC